MRFLRYAPVGLVFLGCGGGDTDTAQRRAAAANDPTYAGVQARGEFVMGVNQYTSTHVFEPLPDGGRIELERDAADSERAHAPLIVADGAVVLDTSHHTIESGVLAAIEILREQGLPDLDNLLAKN